MRLLQKSFRAALLFWNTIQPQDGPVLLAGHSYCDGATWNGIVVTAGCNAVPTIEKPTYAEV